MQEMIRKGSIDIDSQRIETHIVFISWQDWNQNGLMLRHLSDEDVHEEEDEMVSGGYCVSQCHGGEACQGEGEAANSK